jgi:pSer/pThr/pTyr-binding forkhead associated (FHA) protein
MFQLVSTDDMGARLVFPLVKVKTTIGREDQCDIVLADSEVSREHTKLYIIDKQVQVKDMGSTNGTYLNNKRLEKITPIAPNDQLIIGPNLFKLESVANADEQEVELTCVLSVAQLRELADQPIPERPKGETTIDSPMDETMSGNRNDLMAGIYNKKIGLAKYPSVEIFYGAGSGMKYLLPKGEYSIGRDEQCNICLDDSSISAVHGVLISKNGKVAFEDRGSLNGTILNNRIVKKATLGHRDTIMIGKTKLRFLDPSGSSKSGKDSKSVQIGSGGKVIQPTGFLGKYWIYMALFGILAAALAFVLLKP